MVQRAPEPARSSPTDEQGDGRSALRLVWPVEGRVTESFGPRNHPIRRLMGMHEGIDLAVPAGTPVKAAAPGRVKAAFRGLTSGLSVDLDHGGFTTRYFHLSAIKVQVGQVVKAGEVIGLAGSTGLSTGPHLHFEVHVDGRPVDPLSLLPR
ncbi:MAG TPA: M23 family metallopeptidase [Firmicutes bacterium]|nr:M23 family metallopeptidase [Bacillota bacterium]